jgi:hypothetical protein
MLGILPIRITCRSRQPIEFDLLVSSASRSTLRTWLREGKGIAGSRSEMNAIAQRFRLG